MIRIDLSMFVKLFASILVTVAVFSISRANEINIDNVLPKGYQKGQRPRLPGYSNDSSGPPIEVKAELYVNSFGNIEEAKMEFKMFGYFRQLWNDQRLVGRHNDSIFLKGEDISKIWKPDPYCYNARESTLSGSDADINSLMIIRPTGDVVYSRMTIILAECDMDLHDFPMDVQQCYLKFSSYSYDMRHIFMHWNGSNPVMVGRANLAQFYFTELHVSNYTEGYSLGNYSVIQVDFKFKRRLGYFLIQVYAPDVFVVMLSWVVFWMDRDDMGNRMALGITLILTIMFLMGSINAAMPRVSYPKALDWYLMISFALIFLALIQCIFVFVLVNLYEKKEKMENEDETSKDDTVSKADRDKENLRGEKCEHRVLLITENPAFRRRIDGAENGGDVTDQISLKNDDLLTDRDAENGNRKRSSKVGHCADMLAKIVFPSVFVGFNLVYWMIYLHD